MLVDPLFFDLNLSRTLVQGTRNLSRLINRRRYTMTPSLVILIPSYHCNMRCTVSILHFTPSTAPYLSFYRLFSVSINSSILETSFQPTKLLFSLIVTTYYHTRFRFYKALDTSWSLSQNAWVRNPIRVLVLQLNVMCVFTSSHRYTCAILISRSRRPGSASRVRLLVFPDVVNIPIVVLPITHER